MVLGVIMVSVKELKSVDLNSFTIIGTGISVLIAVLLSILVTIGIGIISPEFQYMSFQQSLLGHLFVEFINIFQTDYSLISSQKNLETSMLHLIMTHLLKYPLPKLQQLLLQLH